MPETTRPAAAKVQRSSFVLVAAFVMVMAARIRTFLRVEWSLDRLGVASESLYHFGNHMVGADSDAVHQKLHGQMPVSEMPGDPQQCAIVARVNFEQLFRFGANAYKASVLAR